MLPQQQQPQSLPAQQPAQPAPPAAAAQRPPGAMPEGMARNVDPRNPLQAALLQRLSTFSSQDAETLKQGVTPQAAGVLKKLLPEIGFVFDQLMGGGGAGGAGGDPSGAGDAGPGAAMPGGQPQRMAAPVAPAASRFNKMT